MRHTKKSANISPESTAEFLFEYEKAVLLCLCDVGAIDSALCAKSIEQLRTARNRKEDIDA